MGRVTIPARWPSSAALSDYASNCGICGVPWRRSQLRYDTRGHLVCPNHGSGRDPAELSLLNAESAAAWAEELASRPPRDEPLEREPGDLEPEASSFIDINDPSLPTWVAPTRALVNRWRASSGVTTNAAGGVTAWADSVGGRTFAPVTPGTSEFRYVAAHAGFRGRPVIQNSMTSAVSRMLSGTGSDFAFLHSGAGSTIVWIAAATSAISLNTSGGSSATAAGVLLRANGSASARFRTGNGAAQVFDILPSGISNRSSPSLWVAVHKSSRSPAAELYRGTTSLGSSSEAATPTSGAAATGLELRCDVTTEISTAEILLYNDELTSAELSELATYAALTYDAIVS